MAAELFYLPFNPVFSLTGLPAGAATITFWYTGTTTLAPVYADAALSQRLANPVQTNGLGRIPTLYLDGAITYRLQVLDAIGTPIGPAIDPYVPGTVVPGLKGDPGGNVMSIGLFAAIGITNPITGAPQPGISVPLGTDIVLTAGWSVKGIGTAEYVADASVTPATVANNRRTQWISANGRGFMLRPGQRLTFEKFGAIADAPTAFTFNATYEQSGFTATLPAPVGATDNADAFDAGMFYSVKGPVGAVNETGGMGVIGFENNDTTKCYFTSRKLQPQFTVHIRGNNYGGDTYPLGTIIRYPPNVGGVLMNHFGTQPAGVPYFGVGGSIIEGIWFQGGGGTDRTAHGYQRRIYCSFRDCTFDSFAGDGHHNVASVGKPFSDPRFGITSGSADYNITIRGAGNNGGYGDGSDMSASIFVNFHVKSCRLAGLIDTGYFQNSYPGFQCNAHGLGLLGSVQHNGRAYFLNDTTPGIGGSTEPGANNLIWRDYGPLANPGGRYPAWVNGGNYAVSVPALIGGQVLLEAPYVENYYLPVAYVQGSAPLTINQGTVAADLPSLNVSFQLPALVSSLGVVQYRTYSPDNITVGANDYVGIGGRDGWLRQHYRQSEGYLWTEMYDGPDLRYGPGTVGSGSRDVWRLSGGNTAKTFGTGAAQPFVLEAQRFAIGSYYNGNDARLMTIGSSSAGPRNGDRAGQGQRFWMNDQGPGGFVEQYCTSGGVIGSTAVFKNAGQIAA